MPLDDRGRRAATPGSARSPTARTWRPSSSASGRGASSPSRSRPCAGAARARARRSPSRSSSATTSRARTRPTRPSYAELAARAGLARHPGHQPPALGAPRVSRRGAREAARDHGERGRVSRRGPRPARRRRRHERALRPGARPPPARWWSGPTSRAPATSCAASSPGAAWVSSTPPATASWSATWPSRSWRPRWPASKRAARLRREARIIAGLEHPGIVPVHDAGTLPGRPGLLRHEARRGPAARRARRRRPGPCAERLRVFLRVCEPVAFAHAHGVIHRDLKPENVMVGPVRRGAGDGLGRGQASARSRTRTSRPASWPTPPRPGDTAHGTVLGTPAYMAPEQARGRRRARRRTQPTCTPSGPSSTSC